MDRRKECNGKLVFTSAVKTCKDQLSIARCGTWCVFCFTAACEPYERVLCDTEENCCCHLALSHCRPADGSAGIEWLERQRVAMASHCQNRNGQRQQDQRFDENERQGPCRCHYSPL